MNVIISVSDEQVRQFENVLTDGNLISRYVPDGHYEYRFAIKCADEDMVFLKLKFPITVLEKLNPVGHFADWKFYQDYLDSLDKL